LYLLIYTETAVYKNSQGGNTLGMSPHPQILSLKILFLDIILCKLGLPIAYEEIHLLFQFMVGLTNFETNLSENSHCQQGTNRMRD
ncbi:hypothetical protein, partial [Klebsiella pneumoniae]|uniref:hypothetical protein n=1 Tax=Klebsiella pneumoniae TaxID=573 RepID=UPI0021092F38